MANPCNIKVVCRVRPLNSKEVSSGSSFVITFPASNALSIGGKVYQYDSVFRDDSSQQYVYSISAQPLVKDVLSGYNATIFAYGQTSSGKTFTMEGEFGDFQLRGIIPQIIYDIFDQIYGMDTNLEFHIKVSYFELYMEKIRDLLDVTKVNLPIHENKQKVPYVKGVTERFVTTPEEILSVIEEGKANRHVSVTNMNAHSSRSHAIFLINIKQENKETHQTLTGKLYLVDLAGSEKVEKTNAQGLTLDEAKTINKSLLALSNVISALSEGTKSHIPYRDSKLTRVLQESLGGNARTTLIICCSPSSSNEPETKGTLQFGVRAKMIKNKVEVNLELTAEEWRKRYEKQKEECDRLKAAVQVYVAELNRWRQGEAVPASEQMALNVSSTKNSTAQIPLSSAIPVEASGEILAPPTSVVKEFEEERSRLYQQLDEKDEEIHKQTQLVEKLTLQLQEAEDIAESSQQEALSLKEQIIAIEKDLTHSQEEVQEVMQALEELAMSYDDKDIEIQTLQEEKNTLNSEMEVLVRCLYDKDNELKTLQDLSLNENKKHKQAITTLFRDLSEMGVILGSKADERLKITDSNNDLTEEDFTLARVHLSNMRIEARTLAEQRNILEQAEREAKSQAEMTMRELNTFRQKCSDLEIQTETLRINMKETEIQKEELEVALKELNDQLVSLREREKETLAAAVHDRRQEQIRQHLEEELQHHQETHQRQLSTLRAEIANKECLIAQLQEYQQRQELAQETLQSEMLHLQLQRQEFTNLSHRLAVRENAEHEYSGLKDTVDTELSQLDTLKKALYEKLMGRLDVKNSKTPDSILLSTPERGEVKFLEKNLDELSRVHKKTLSTYADVQRQIPKYQAVLESKTKRIKELETVLKETREAANREYHKFHEEKEKMRNGYLAKLREKERTPNRRPGPTIVRPVPRPQGVESGGGAPSGVNSREALLAVAGVHIVGQKSSPLLNSMTDKSSNSISTSSQSSGH